MKDVFLTGLTLFTLLLFSSGCVSQSSWTPAVDTANDPHADRLPQDEAECREIAQKGAATNKETARGAAEGAAVGVLAGAALGAIGGSPGVGAMAGASSGAVGGGASMARDSNSDFKRIFTNCLKERGHPALN